jgi:alkanesulfonate monooxygenase SsuD/methylene tetrahydromethanopterin reductase-like flavin-dependent oxidoreductase (luciferase family)
MRVGVMVPMSLSDGSGRMPSWEDVRAFAAHAEDAGLDAVWVCDHFLSGGPGLPPEGIHEGWTILSALAASTSRVELGQLVMCVSFRNPALLAKMAVTADDVSGGRVLLGLGAGWYDPEYEAFGYPTDHRVGRLEEALQIICPLLRGEAVTFAGRYHDVHDGALLPSPARRIPVLVAGDGERMLRLTARYADAWNTAWFREPNDRLRDLLAKLDAALDAGILLQDETLDVAWNTTTASSGVPLPMGLGWFVQSYRGERVVWHFGYVPGAYSSLVLKMPGRHVTFILLANSDGLSAPYQLQQGDVTKSLFAALFLRLFR